MLGKPTVHQSSHYARQQHERLCGGRKETIAAGQQVQRGRSAQVVDDHREHGQAAEEVEAEVAPVVYRVRQRIQSLTKRGQEMAHSMTSWTVCRLAGASRSLARSRRWDRRI